MDTRLNESRSKTLRCCNLDWLEVFCIEPDEPRTADYFEAHGVAVRKRDYGTRVYREMFVVLDRDNLPYCEVRREPVGQLTGTSILPYGSCHIRLVNRSCYFDRAAETLRQWLSAWGYEFQRISRLDVCLDFERFDRGDIPAKFLKRYLEGKFRKINQGRIHVHGEDTWTGQTYNSCSWGSRHSQVSTKLYNKTLELREVHDKPYIRQSWFECGLVDHPVELYKVRSDGSRYQPEIWRLEFSISSAVRNWYTIEEDGNHRKLHSYRHDLEAWNTREKCYDKFISLVPHYFMFRYYEEGVRKDRCQEKVLFWLRPQDRVYHIEHIAPAEKPDMTRERLRFMLLRYRETHNERELHQAIDYLVKYLVDERTRLEAAAPYDRDFTRRQLELIADRLSGDNPDIFEALDKLFSLPSSPDDLPF